MFNKWGMLDSFVMNGKLISKGPKVLEKKKKLVLTLRIISCWTT